MRIFNLALIKLSKYNRLLAIEREYWRLIKVEAEYKRLTDRDAKGRFVKNEEG